MITSSGAVLPWNELMAFGMGRLGLSSGEFWSMTPRELMASAGILGETNSPQEPITRGKLAEMIRLYPDNMKVRQ